MTDIEKVKALCDYLVKEWNSEKLRWGWGEALFTYALSEFDIFLNEERYLPFYKTYCDYYVKNTPIVDCSDTAAPALTTYAMYKKTGNLEYKKLTDLAINYINNSEKILEDIPNHFGFSKDAKYPSSIWVDSLMMFSVFTARYGAEQGISQFTDYAAKQPQVFAKYLMDAQEGCWYHAYWVKQKTHYPKRKLFWGRGNGWVVASFPMIVEFLGEKNEYRDEIIKIYKNSIDGILKYQRSDGTFNTVMNKKTYRELSATILIAGGLYHSLRLGLIDESYKQKADNAYKACIDSLIFKEDGSVHFPEISRPTVPMQYIPYLWYKFLPKGSNWNYGVASLILACIEHNKLLKCKSNK